MKIGKFLTLTTLSCVWPLLFLQGCGGGGGGGNGGGTVGTPTPTTSATPSGTTGTLQVQLKDSSGGVVDGIVTLDKVVVVVSGKQTQVSKVLPTSGGLVTFGAVVLGNRTVVAEVNGVETKGTVSITGTALKTLVLTISSSITPNPTTTVPPPPF